ncbi:hypothetical protein CBR_g37821 [Chara braunii]|uniref:Uncharacterized protein n=1 Tax=Chara braunii TaxID=69332 RepID=A0A388LNV9_CHABU|nr:hypothetical protein CBR_g37821 [Chara braunii]|eukprot:GBG83949.1 hypothetical protein CBR_g37821 [Chara braunii]
MSRSCRVPCVQDQLAVSLLGGRRCKEDVIPQELLSPFTKDIQESYVGETLRTSLVHYRLLPETRSLEDIDSPPKRGKIPEAVVSQIRVAMAHQAEDENNHEMQIRRRIFLLEKAGESTIFSDREDQENWGKIYIPYPLPRHHPIVALHVGVPTLQAATMPGPGKEPARGAAATGSSAANVIHARKGPDLVPTVLAGRIRSKNLQSKLLRKPERYLLLDDKPLQLTLCSCPCHYSFASCPSLCVNPGKNPANCWIRGTHSKGTGDPQSAMLVPGGGGGLGVRNQGPRGSDLLGIQRHHTWNYLGRTSATQIHAHLDHHHHHHHHSLRDAGVPGAEYNIVRLDKRPKLSLAPLDVLAVTKLANTSGTAAAQHHGKVSGMHSTETSEGSKHSKALPSPVFSHVVGEEGKGGRSLTTQEGPTFSPLYSRSESCPV